MTPPASLFTREWKTQVHALNLSQPDGRTCQSACIAMAVGRPDIYDIRSQLVMRGDPGSPATMGQVLRGYLKDRYIFNESASMEDMVQYLRNGEFLITHGWFTDSGHVICLDGLTERENKTPLFSVKDPWSEFDGPSWTYNAPSIKFFDGNYSSQIIYAACVEGCSRSHAAALYHRNKVDRQRKQAWVHRILPSIRRPNATTQFNASFLP